MHEQETIKHKDTQSIPDETVVPPGQSGVEQTEKQGGAELPTENEDFNQDGKPVKLPVENPKFDVRM